MSADIINLRDRQQHQGKPEATTIDHDGFSECAPMHYLEEMPFVDPKPPGFPNTRREWNCWNDVPTDDSLDDYRPRRAIRTNGARCDGGSQRSIWRPQACTQHCRKQP